jgi:hypothetical protein
MKICQQSIHDAKFITWDDRKIGKSRASLDSVVEARRRFKRTRGSGADCDHASTRGARVIDRLSGLISDRRPFRRDAMVADIVRAHGFKGTVTHMQSDFSD